MVHIDMSAISIVSLLLAQCRLVLSCFHMIKIQHKKFFV
jgi:hypothetical protein